jgi:hypothetical protein
VFTIAPRPTLRHLGGEGATGREGGGEVAGDQVVPVLGRDRQDRGPRWFDDAGAIDQDVDIAQFASRGLKLGHDVGIGG